jgi:hypothetical protein
MCSLASFLTAAKSGPLTGLRRGGRGKPSSADFRRSSASVGTAGSWRAASMASRSRSSVSSSSLSRSHRRRCCAAVGTDSTGSGVTLGGGSQPNACSSASSSERRRSCLRVSGGSIPERPRLLPQLGVGGYAALGHRRLHAQHPRVRVGRVRDYRDLEQVQLEQIVDAAALAGLERDVAEAERDGIVLHRPPRLAGDLAVVKVELALDVQPQVYLARAGRID